MCLPQAHEWSCAASQRTVRIRVEARFHLVLFVLYVQGFCDDPPVRLAMHANYLVCLIVVGAELS